MASEQTASEASAFVASQEDARLVRRLREGDERAFAEIVDSYSSSMLRLATVFAGSRAVAEEIVQETWLGVIKGLERFEGRSSLKTWVFRILTNTAKTRAQREGRSIPFSSVSTADSDPGEPSVDPDRFIDAADSHWPGHWVSSPRQWSDLPEQRLLSAEVRERIEVVIETLPPAQREVITLRDVQGFGSEEVCDLLGVSEGNQRVLLHRARSKVRRALDDYLE